MKKQMNKSEEYELYKQEKKEFSRLKKKALVELVYELQYQNELLIIKNKKLEEKLVRKNEKIKSYSAAIKNLVEENF